MELGVGVGDVDVGSLVGAAKEAVMERVRHVESVLCWIRPQPGAASTPPRSPPFAIAPLKKRTDTSAISAISASGWWNKRRFSWPTSSASRKCRPCRRPPR